MKYLNFSYYVLSLSLFTTTLIISCTTFGTYETARTAPPGKFHIGGAITPMHMYTSENGLTDEKELAFLFFPLPEFAAKMGVSQNFDIGIRWAIGPGMTFTGKYQFLRGPTDGAFSLYGSFYGFALSGATVGFYGLSPRLIISSEAPNAFPFSANAGINFSGVAAGAEGSTASGSVLSAVAGFGFPFRTGSTRSFRIMPELSLTLPITSSFEADDISGSQNLIGNLSISFGFGFTSVGPYE